MNEETGIPKDLKHLGKSYLKIGVAVPCNYVTQRQNRPKVVNFSFEKGKETRKSCLQETRTSGTYRY